MSDLPREATRAKGLLLVGAVFLLGLVCGAALFFLGQHSVGHFAPHAPPRPGMPPAAAVDHLIELLELDGEQEREVRRIFARGHEEVGAALEKAHEDLLGVLTPEQRARFGRLHRWGRRAPGPHGPHGHPPPPPPPG